MDIPAIRFWYVSWFIVIHLFSEISSARIPVGRKVASPSVCTSTECINEARIIFEFRNTSAKPCDDFFEFVCGGWTASHPPTPDRSNRNLYDDLTSLNMERIRDILEAESDIKEQEFVQKVKNFYQACLERDEQVEDNLRILKQRLDVWGGWPIATERWENKKFEWQNLLLRLLRINDLHPLFRITVSEDYRNVSRPRLTIEQGDGRFCYYLESREEEEKLRKVIVKTALKIANATNQNVCETKVEQEAGRLCRLSSQICKIQRNKKGLYTDTSRYSTRTVREIQKLTDDVQPLNGFAQIKWLKLLNDYLQGSTVNIDEDEEIMVPVPDYIPDIVELIDNTAQRTLANYMLWYHIEWMGADEWLGADKEVLDSEEENPENTSKTDEKEKRWKTCVAETDELFHHAVGYQYVKLYYDDNIKESAEEFVKNIHTSFIDDLMNNKWMDENSRKETVEKAKNMKFRVGYPDWYDVSELNDLYREYTVGDNFILNLETVNAIIYQGDLNVFDGTANVTNFWQPITAANAFNYYMYNVVVIPSGVFQPPLFVKGRPQALNYGALGPTIGHEISHSFDVIGIKYDRFGGLSNSWNPQTLKKFQKKKQCIEEIYSEYPTPELNDEKVWRLDGHSTIAEDMADIGGLEIAFSAFKKYLREHGPEKKLPGLTQYTSEQLFFIGNGMGWCESAASENIIETILTDEHTPGRYRALITMANSKDFTEVWKCKEGDKMYSLKKCPFWQN